MTNPTPEQMAEVARANEDSIMSKPNVVGYDIGYKYVDGVMTEDICIRVFVREKKEVAEGEAIPDTIGGIETDVIERTFELLELAVHEEAVIEPGPKIDPDYYDPLVGGISIGPCPIDNMSGIGTLGAIMRSSYPTSQFLALSNYHVLCIQGWKIGHEVSQPSIGDGGKCDDDDIGGIVQGVYGGKVDCAVAAAAERGVSSSIEEIGPVAGTTQAQPGMAVRKRGRTTELTYGIVEGIHGTLKYDVGGSEGGKFTDQITINPQGSSHFLDNGDSGSVVVDSDNQVVGLLWGESPTNLGLANPISAVMQALNTQIYTLANTPTHTILENFRGVYGPALATHGELLLLAWVQPAGGSVESGLNVAYSYDGTTFSNAINLGVLPDAAPAMAFLDDDEGGNFIVAFNNITDNGLYTFLSQDGREWLGAWPVNETSPSAPALAVFKSKLYLAYQGGDNKLNVISSSDGKQWEDNVTISQLTNQGLGLAVLNDRLYLSWKGKDSNTIYFISSDDGINFGSIVHLDNETTLNRLALCQFSGRLYLSWEGMDSSHRINFLSSIDGISWTDKLKMDETCTNGPALAAFDHVEALVLAWTGRDDRHTLNVFR